MIEKIGNPSHDQVHEWGEFLHKEALILPVTRRLAYAGPTNSAHLPVAMLLNRR